MTDAALCVCAWWYGLLCVRVCACVCVCACVRVCLWVCSANDASEAREMSRSLLLVPAVALLLLQG